MELEEGLQLKKMTFMGGEKGWGGGRGRQAIKLL